MSIIRHEPGEFFCGAIVHGETVYVSGKTATDTSQGVRGQTRQILAEIDRSLALCGSDKSKLLMVNIWLTDIRKWSKMNEVWDEWVDPHNKPCRATVEAALAAPDLKVEIACVAAR
ncbi:MAG: RidA family protein [Pseudomonadota bacterium]